MSNFLYILLGAALVLGLNLIRRLYASFVAQKSSDYAISAGLFDLRKHMNGLIACEGVIFGLFGQR